MSTSSGMTTVFHARPCGRLIGIKSNFGRKKHHRTYQGFKFLGGSFSNEDNVRNLIQFRRERQSQHPKTFSHQNRPIRFDTSSTRVIRLVKQNKLSFSSIERVSSIFGFTTLLIGGSNVI